MVILMAGFFVINILFAQSVEKANIALTENSTAVIKAQLR
jgi:hypothetical protein